LLSIVIALILVLIECSLRIGVIIVKVVKVVVEHKGRVIIGSTLSLLSSSSKSKGILY
jgi:hypothetical protein